MLITLGHLKKRRGLIFHRWLLCMGHNLEISSGSVKNTSDSWRGPLMMRRQVVVWGLMDAGKPKEQPLALTTWSSALRKELCYGMSTFGAQPYRTCWTHATSHGWLACRVGDWVLSKFCTYLGGPCPVFLSPGILPSMAQRPLVAELWNSTSQLGACEVQNWGEGKGNKPYWVCYSMFLGVY